MHDVFISYSKHDRSRVERLVAVLEAEGWTVYWDRRLLAGDAWHVQIATELQAAGCVIVAWSPRSTASNWVRDEATQALERGVLVPVVIDPVALPLGFGQVHTIAVMDAAGAVVTDAVPDLLASVRRHLRASAATRVARPAPVAAAAATFPPAAAGPSRVERRRRALFLGVYSLLVMGMVTLASVALSDGLLATLIVLVGSLAIGVTARRLARGPVRHPGARPGGFATLVLPVAAPILIAAVLFHGPVLRRTLFAVVAGLAGAGVATLAARRGTTHTEPPQRIAGQAAGAGVTWFASVFVVATALGFDMSYRLAMARASTDEVNPFSSVSGLLGRAVLADDAILWLWVAALVMAAGVAPAIRRGLESDG